MKKKLLFSILFFLFLLEIGLRVLGIYNSYGESTNGIYQSYYGKTRPSWYFTWQPNLDFIYKQKEFSYRLRTNSLGIREVEFQKEKSKNDFRIIVLGDSFTEGDGVAYEYSYPRMLEQKMKEKCTDSSKTYTLWNAGVCGSDVLYSYVLLRDKLVEYNPDFVIININNSDLNDFIFRGGMERFLPDGTTVNKKGPWYNKLFMLSHTLRMVIKLSNPHFDINMMMDNDKLQAVKKEAIVEIINAINQITLLCLEKNIKFTFVFHPFPFELNGPNGEIQEVIDYLPPYTPVINILDPMREATKSYQYEEIAWPINLHYNQKGYEIMGEVVFEALMDHNTFFRENCKDEQ